MGGLNVRLNGLSEQEPSVSTVQKDSIKQKKKVRETRPTPFQRNNLELEMPLFHLSINYAKTRLEDSRFIFLFPGCIE